MKKIFTFDFWQKFGKALMVVIAVMPAAGLMISIGKMIAMFSGDVQLLLTTAGVIEDLGWAVIVNLHILFAVAIGGSWAKERAGGAFAALLAFILINRTTGKLFAVTGDMLATDGATTKTLFGQDILVNGYFTNVLGAPALNMGVFVGIIAGFVGAVIFNKYYNYRKLPDALSFFNGKRFVPFVVIGWSVLISLVLAIIWPVVQTGINNFGIWIADSADTAPILAPFVYGTLERLLLPFGSAPYADDSDELHFFGWNLHNVDRRCRRFASVRSRSALVGLGQRFGELEQRRRYSSLQRVAERIHSGPL